MDGHELKAEVLGFDWAQAWRDFSGERNRPDSAAEWDKRAHSFPTKHGKQNGYVERFFQLADIRPGETVLDMGCGTGALATPLAIAGHSVIACDFSRGMLDRMVEDQQGLSTADGSPLDVRVVNMSWQDDWTDFGIGENAVDVALASRSISTSDLADALEKLTSTARRRACITLPRSMSPRSDDELLAVAGFEAARPPEFVYAFNILVAQGHRPTVDYIVNTREETFATREDAVDALWTVVDQCADASASELDEAVVRARIGAWLDGGNLVPNEAAGHVDRNGVEQLPLRLAHPRNVSWAFIAWDMD